MDSELAAAISFVAQSDLAADETIVLMNHADFSGECQKFIADRGFYDFKLRLEQVNIQGFLFRMGHFVIPDLIVN